ncbi:hypothetical protein KSS87_010106, partial [Heliosperma pusillum]
MSIGMNNVITFSKPSFVINNLQLQSITSRISISSNNSTLQHLQYFFHFTSTNLYPRNIKLMKVRGSSESVPPPSPTPPSNSFPGFPGISNFTLDTILEEQMGSIDIQTLEDAVEVVEKVADEVEKLAEDVVEDLPQGKLKNVAAKVEHVAELVAEAAHLADSAIDKVQELEEEAASFVAKEEANFDKKRDSVHDVGLAEVTPMGPVSGSTSLLGSTLTGSEGSEDPLGIDHSLDQQGLPPSSQAVEMHQDAWNTHISGSASYRFFYKLKLVKQKLKTLHKESFKGISCRLAEAKAQLFECQLALQRDELSEDLILRERGLLENYIKVRKIERNILKQRAKSVHISQNDSSSKYFFSKIKERTSQQIIGQIKDREGKDRYGQDDVVAGFVEYYEKLLGQATSVASLDE